MFRWHAASALDLKSQDKYFQYNLKWMLLIEDNDRITTDAGPTEEFYMLYSNLSAWIW